MSHDPSHWEYEVKNHDKNFSTLSGHTHGMQFGIEFQVILNGLHSMFTMGWLYEI
jgi:hypothetical protein